MKRIEPYLIILCLAIIGYHANVYDEEELSLCIDITCALCVLSTYFRKMSGRWRIIITQTLNTLCLVSGTVTSVYALTQGPVGIAFGAVFFAYWYQR